MLDNKNIQKVFSLSDFRKKQLVGDVPQRTRETYREYGYFGGGNYICLVQRIDYSNDTQNSSPRGTFLVRFSEAAAAGNSNYGWHGGRDLSGGSLIQRIDYSNDSQTSLRGRLSLARVGLAASGNLNYGWFGGGNIPGQPLLSQVDRIDYANDLSTSIVRGPLGSGRYSFGATGNSNFGYFGLGGQTTILERISYSNDSVIALRRGNFIFGRTYTDSCATGNSNFGYFSGGLSGGSGYRSIVERVNYSNDTSTASTRGPLSVGRAWTSGSGNSNFGYYAGGGTDIPNIYGNRIVDRIDYSSDTTVLLVRGLLDVGTRDASATSSASFGGAPNSSFASDFTFPTVPNAGYFGGGSDGTNNLATIDKVDYANDTSTASVRSALSSAKVYVKSVSNNNFGYYNGATAYPATSSTIDRIEFSSDTQNAVVRGPLSLARNRGAATGNSNFGYFGGGYAPGNSNVVDRIDYSNDTAQAIQKCILTLARRDFSATGNNNFGYFGGGFSSAAVSIVDRLDYANDTLNTLSRGNIIARYDNIAVGNNSFGYFGGGTPGVSSVDRVDYSNDTQTASVRGPLSSGRGSSAATGSNNFGYIGGGFVPSGSPIYYSTTDRINYSNDTASLSIRGPLSTGKGNLAATSPLAYGGAPIYFTNPLPEVLQKQIVFNNSNTLDLPFKRVLGSFGYFGGGYRGGPIPQSSVERINFSSDTTILSNRGFLTDGFNTASIGTPNYGYYRNGYSSAPIERIDYGNDSANSIVRSAIRARVRPGVATNQNYSWWSGGFSGYTAVDRLDYSNDNTSALARGSLNFGSNYGSSIGNNYYGYVYVGTGTRIQRIDYANDNVLTSYRGTLAIAQSNGSALGNLNFGYFAGSLGSTSFNRIDYSNDLSTATLRGLTLNQTSVSGFLSNSNFGYYAGGSSNFSSVTRFDFSNDLSTASRVNSLNIGRTTAGGSTNARNSQ